MTTVSILNAPKTRCAALHSRLDAVDFVETGERHEAIAAERVEAHRDAPEARRRETVDLILEQDAVGGEREIGKPRLAGNHPDQRGEVAPQQRLAAGEPNLVHAERQEDVDQRGDFLEVQEVFAGKPHVVRFRHAVQAPEIAAVGHRQPQVAQRTASVSCSMNPEIIGRLRPEHLQPRPGAGEERPGGDLAVEARGSSGPGPAPRQRGQRPSSLIL